MGFASTMELRVVYRNLRMVKMNIYKLWYQNQVFLKYYTAFTIVFPVDTLELLRQLPNFENNFTGQLTKTMLKIGFADI